MKRKASQLGSNSSTEDPGSGSDSTSGESAGVSAGEFAEQTTTGPGGTGVVPPHVLIGVLGRPHGLDGTLGLYIDPADLVYVETGATVFVVDDPYTVRAVRSGKKGPLVTFAEVTDRETAESIRGSDVFAAVRRELSDGEYWPEDLIGLEVRPGGGVVTGVEHGAAQARLVVSRGEVSFEVPFVSDLVPTVDIDGGFVEIVDLPGLSSLSDRE